jgi:D-xylose transport system ATP-binding protein
VHALEMEGITKEFPGTRALDGVSFAVRKGTIHALLGENGAGKSTLMKILSGVYPAGSYEGRIRINGEEKRFRNPRDAEAAGIAVIHQELSLVGEMTVSENIFLGDEPRRWGVIDREEMHVQAKKWLDFLGLDLDPEAKVGSLGIGQQQLVEIAKALSKKSDILILDEPTSALADEEVRRLTGILKDLSGKGVTCVYISHKLNEVMDLADAVTVLRDGKVAGTSLIGEWTEDKIISMMVGRKLGALYPGRKRGAGETVLEVRNYSVYHPARRGKKVVHDVSFSLRKGEVLGFAGLVGAGRTELFAGIFGAHEGRTEGTVLLEGREITLRHPGEAIRRGIVYLPEDRKRYGLFLGMDIKKNLTMASLDRLVKWGIVDEERELREAEEQAARMRVKMADIEMRIRGLSGGNQQKVLLGKSLMTRPKVLILDEPTRGVDIGAKADIYQIIGELSREGVAVVLISSDLPEVIGMSDRILVMAGGRLVGEFEQGEATEEKIMACVTGGGAFA